MQGIAVKGSLKKVENSFICRRCKGELCETRQVNSQVNGLYIDSHEYEIVDKLCYLGDMLSQEGDCEHAILKKIQTESCCGLVVMSCDSHSRGHGF